MKRKIKPVTLLLVFVLFVALSTNVYASGAEEKSAVVCPRCKAPVNSYSEDRFYERGEVLCSKGAVDTITGAKLHDMIIVKNIYTVWECPNISCGWRDSSLINTGTQIIICEH